MASFRLTKSRWAKATEAGYPTVTLTNQMEAVKQCTSFLFPAPELLGVLMDCNVPKVLDRVRVHDAAGVAYTAAMGYLFLQPIPTWENFLSICKEMSPAYAILKRR